jgi:hypothetical protein
MLRRKVKDVIREENTDVFIELKDVVVAPLIDKIGILGL